MDAAGLQVNEIRLPDYFGIKGDFVRIALGDLVPGPANCYEAQPSSEKLSSKKGRAANMGALICPVLGDPTYTWEESAGAHLFYPALLIHPIDVSPGYEWRATDIFDLLYEKAAAIAGRESLEYIVANFVDPGTEAHRFITAKGFELAPLQSVEYDSSGRDQVWLKNVA